MKLYNGDCLKILKNFDDNSLDYVFTSPPYNIGRTRNSKSNMNAKYEFFNDNNENYFNWCVEIINQLLRVTKKYVIWNIQPNYSNKKDVFKLIGHFADNLQQNIIWHKPNGTPSSIQYKVSNVIEYILFFTNNKLIYLKNKNNVNIQIPTIGYYTESKELLPFISVMGIKSSSSRTFGAFYYFQNYKNAFRGSWSSNYKKREIQNKIITDDNGLLKCPGFVRFAIFVGKPRVALYRPTDPFYDYIKLLDTTQPTKKNIAKIKWAKKYDSIIISHFKYKNIDG